MKFKNKKTGEIKEWDCIKINSSLVSAQNRVRLYWTNIEGVEQPKDKGIVLKDILQDLPFTEPPQYLLNKFGNKVRGDMVKSVDDDKARCLTATMWKGQIGSFVKCARVVGRKINPETGKRDDYNPDLKIEQRIEPRKDEKSGTLTTVQKDNVLIVSEATKKGYTEIQDGDCFDATFINSKTRRGRNMKDKSNCMTATNFDFMRYEYPGFRKLTPIECERLQTMPDNYTEGVSNSQRYKMVGNGWTINVVAHILSYKYK